MKITTNMLKQLIKEELAALMQENKGPGRSAMATGLDPLRTPADTQAARAALAAEEEKVAHELNFSDPPAADPVSDDAFAAAEEEERTTLARVADEVQTSSDALDAAEEEARTTRRKTALKGTDALRRQINQLRKRGKISKDVHVAARRALYKGDGGRKARRIIAQATRHRSAKLDSGSDPHRPAMFGLDRPKSAARRPAMFQEGLKITQKQLQQIIKEELAEVMQNTRDEN